MLEMTTTERWVAYGIMWLIVLSLLYISHKVDATTEAPPKDIQ